jgi:translation initiation factor IF-3
MQSKGSTGNYKKKPYNSSAGFQLGQSASTAAPNKYGAQLGQGSARPAVSSGPTRSYTSSGSSAPRPYTPSTGARPFNSSGSRPYTPGSRPYTPGAPRPYTPGSRPYTPGGAGGYSSAGGYPRRSFDDRREFKKRDDGPNRNFWIRAPKVLVIDDEGENLGEMETSKAMAIAVERDLDLVEVSPNANPPVCRIINYSKYLYEQKKKSKTAKTAVSKEMKELKFSPVIDEHDINTRINRAFEFLGKGHNVRLTIERKGRQTIDQVNAVMARLLTSFEGYSTIEPGPKFEGKKTYITFKRDGKAKNKKNISQKS